jgi:AhpD family alkylhydroperoxidase
MARISLDPPRTLSNRIAAAFSRRRYGTVLDPVAAMGHNRRVGLSYGLFELQVERWRKLDHGLKDLAVMATAAAIGCSWCMDFGYWEGHRLGISPEKLRAVPFWREHMDLFSELELAVLEYAEEMCESEPDVSDELAATLLARLGEPAFVELTVMVGIENLRSRVNSALGLRSQGFADRCEAGKARPVPSRQ